MLVLTIAFLIVVFRIPAMFSHRLASTIAGALEKLGVDISGTITPEEFFYFMLALLLVIMVLAFIAGRDKADEK